MEENHEIELAWQVIENTGTHLFLTGKAGTGKTTFLRRLKELTPKRMVVVAQRGLLPLNPEVYLNTTFLSFTYQHTLQQAHLILLNKVFINSEKRKSTLSVVWTCW